MLDKQIPELSIVTPLFNEEKNLQALADRLQATLCASGDLWEWVAVDDGSVDKTFETALKTLPVAPAWQMLRLSRNFGQQAAYRAGLEAAQGKAVVFLDADMQDPPEAIPEMIEKWRQGASHVVGRRTSRPEKGIRGILFRAFHEIFYRVTGQVMAKDSGTFALMDRRLADALIAMPERGMFLPAQRGWLGFPTAYVWYERAERADEPKQSMRKLFSYAWEGITSFSAFPLHLISIMGAVISVIGFSYAIILITIKLLQFFGWLTAWIVPGFTTISVAVLCLGGIQLLSLGVIGSYLAKVFAEVKRRPLYVTEQHLRGSDK